MSARLLLALALAAGCASPPPPPAPPVSEGTYAMGTLLEVTLHGVDPDAAPAVFEALFAEAARLEALFSTWDPSSELSRVNAGAARGPEPVSAELAELLRRSQEYARLTRGAFDISVGPLVALWTRAAERDALPPADALADARERVGPRVYTLSGAGEVSFARPGVALDLGGIAKGYALDRMRGQLVARGLGSALLSFGQSSVWALGAPPGEPGWRLLVRAPGGGFAGLVTLVDRALSVSGSLGQWVEIAGRRYGHVLDPRSGEPLRRRRQALVLAPDATLAEALSKALLVLGEDEGLALVAAQRGCEALLLDAEGGSWATPGFRAAAAFERLE